MLRQINVYIEIQAIFCFFFVNLILLFLKLELWRFTIFLDTIGSISMVIDEEGKSNQWENHQQSSVPIYNICHMYGHFSSLKQ